MCSAQIGDTHYPLVGADMARIKSYRRHAELIHRMTGYPVRLVRFAHREDIEVL